MPALVAPGVCRFAVTGSYGGHDVVNIVDMFISTTGTMEDRGEVCEAQAGIIVNEWDDSILSITNSEYTAVSVSWLDLDSTDGTVGVRAETSETTWPQPGRSTGGGAPGNVALRVNKNTVARRGERQGRMYLAGVAEGWTTDGEPNQVAEDIPDSLNPLLASFLGDINQDGDIDPGAEYESKMVVVHTRDGVFTSTSDVNSLTVDLFTASQVRRIRRR